MAATGTTCKQCKTGMSLQSLDPACGEQGVLKVTFIQLPALVCANMHRHFASQEFPIQVLDRVAGKDMEALPAGRKSGLIFKHYHCSACGGELEKGNGREETFDFDVTLQGLPTFRVEMTVPLYKCTACGKEQMRSLEEMQHLAPPAMAHAFKAAGLRPE